MSFEINNTSIKNSINSVKNNKAITFKSNSTPKDKVEISSKKKEFSTEEKVGIGLGICTIIAIGIYKRKSLKNLWEKIFGKSNKNPPEKPNNPSKPSEIPSKPKPEKNTPFNDIKDFGTKLADGTILFKTEQGAIDYARKVICEALQGAKEKQIEIGVAIKGKKILGIAGGSYGNVDATKIKGVERLAKEDVCSNAKRDIILLHGHPDYFCKGKTLPLSFDDINMLRRFNFKSVVAYNSKGEYNKIEIYDADKFAAPLLKDFKYVNIELKYLSKKLLSQKEYERLWQLEETLKKYEIDKIKVPEALNKEHDILLNKIDTLRPEYEKTEDYAIMRHIMYENEAEASGLIYSTNFSNLLK